MEFVSVPNPDQAKVNKVLSKMLEPAEVVSLSSNSNSKTSSSDMPLVEQSVHVNKNIPVTPKVMNPKSVGKTNDVLKKYNESEKNNKSKKSAQKIQSKRDSNSSISSNSNSSGIKETINPEKRPLLQAVKHPRVIINSIGPMSGDSGESMKKKQKIHDQSQQIVAPKSGSTAESAAKVSAPPRTLILLDEPPNKKSHVEPPKISIPPVKTALSENKAKPAPATEVIVNATKKSVAASESSAFKIPRMNTDKPVVKKPAEVITAPSLPAAKPASIQSISPFRPIVNPTTKASTHKTNSTTNPNSNSLSVAKAPSTTISVAKTKPSETPAIPNAPKSNKGHKTQSILERHLNPANASSLVKRNALKVASTKTAQERAKSTQNALLTYAQLTEQRQDFIANTGFKHAYVSPLFLMNNYVSQMSKIQSLDPKLLGENLPDKALFAKNAALGLSESENVNLCKLMSRNAGKINFFELYSLRPCDFKSKVYAALENSLIESSASRESDRLNTLLTAPLMHSFGFYCNFKEKIAAPYRMFDPFWTRKTFFFYKLTK